MLKLLFAIAAVSATAPLAASEREAPRTVHVRYADLDLTTLPGKATLDRRIARALRDACPEDPELGLVRQPEAMRCRRSALAQVALQRSNVLAAAEARVATRTMALNDR